MIFRFSLLYAVLIFLPVDSYLQNPSEYDLSMFAMKDSIVLSSPDGGNLYGHISIFGDEIRLLTRKNIIKYDMSGNIKSNVGLAELNSSIDTLQPKILSRQKSMIFLDYNNNQLTRIGEDGTLLLGLRPRKGKIKYRFRRGYTSYNFFDFDEENNYAIVRLSPYRWKPFKSKKKFFKEGTKYYQTKGLIGIFNNTGRLIRTIDEYNNIYRKQKFIPYIDQIYSCYDSEGKIVYIGQMAVPEIRAYNILTGKLVNTMNTEKSGVVQTLKTIDNRDDFHNKNTEYVIISNTYNNLYYHNESKSIIRIYKPAIEDTTSIDTKYEALKKEYEEKKIKACPPPSKQAMARQKLGMERPCFLQVLNTSSDNCLIFEQDLGLKYPTIIGHKGNDFYILGSRTDNKKFIIYIYTLK